MELTDYVDGIVKQVPASIVTDAKSLYDGVEKRESFSAGLQDRRSGIEVVAIRQQVRDQASRSDGPTVINRLQTDSPRWQQDQD